MANRAAATRYARALLDVAERQGQLERVEQEASAFAALIEEQPLLRKSLLNPAVPPAPKRAVVASLLEHAGGQCEITVRLLTLLAERNRLTLLPEIVEVFRDQLMEHRGVVRARITTAEPLPAPRIEEITKRLASATGKQVMVETGTDPDVIGGLVTQIGSTVWDGSIARHLERLRHRFLSEG